MTRMTPLTPVSGTCPGTRGGMPGGVLFFFLKEKSMIEWINLKLELTKCFRSFLKD